MKRLICLPFVLLLMLSLTACENKCDTIDIYNKSDWVFDNINIEIKEGYFYQSHETFAVDENTVGVTVYFSNKDNEWEIKGGVDNAE